MTNTGSFETETTPLPEPKTQDQLEQKRDVKRENEGNNSISPLSHEGVQTEKKRMFRQAVQNIVATARDGNLPDQLDFQE